MNNSRPIVIEGGAVFTPNEEFNPGRIVIEGPFITAAGAPSSLDIPERAHIIDASNLIVTPGFIEPHIHGGGGVDVMDGSHAAMNTVSRLAAMHGTTSFLATTVSAPADALTRAVEQLGSLMRKSFEGATPLGIHLEGPFISSAKRGTHDSSNVMAPDQSLFLKWIDAANGFLRLITLAPEIKGADAIAHTAQRQGVCVAMGHSDATYLEAKAAADSGVKYAVHTFNAMRALGHRDPGVVGLALSDDSIFAEIIADGVHVDPAVIKLFARAKTRDRVLLVTDAMSATAMPDGSYSLGQARVTVSGGVCRDSEGRLAGSTLTQDVALRNFLQWSGFGLGDALHGLTLNPARALGLSSKGRLKAGADADITILDKNFRVHKTFVAGKLVFDGNSGFCT